MKDVESISKVVVTALVAIAVLILQGCGKTDPGTGFTGTGGQINNDCEPMPFAFPRFARDGYSWQPLSDGSRVYNDREFTYNTIPPSLQGKQVLLTSNDDKAEQASRFLVFEVDVPVVVYVAYDQRVEAPVAWLRQWQKTPWTLETTDTTLEIYSRTLPAGSVVLGGNDAPGFSMYTVILNPVNEAAAGIVPQDCRTTADTPGVPANNTPGSQTNGSGGAFLPPLVLQDDAAQVEMNQTLTLAVLENDTEIGADRVNIGLAVTPSHGQVTFNGDGTLTYTPQSNYIGEDRFHYQATAVSGARGTAEVVIDVVCDTCATNAMVSVSWDASHGWVSHYDIYYVKGNGTVSPAQATTLLESIRVSSAGFNPTAPQKRYQAWQALQLRHGETVCFRMRARNFRDTSAYSVGQCATVP